MAHIKFLSKPDGDSDRRIAVLAFIGVYANEFKEWI